MLSLNNFNMPKVYSSELADAIHIVYLLLLDKGKFQSHPNMGVGLRTQWRWNNQENLLDALQNEIEDQITTYLPNIHVDNIELTLNEDHILGILITCNGITYPLAYDINKDDLQFGSEAEYII